MSKRIWVGIGIAIAVISGLAWLLADELADWIVGIFSQWRTVDPVLREDIKQGVQIIAPIVSALAAIGSFLYGVSKKPAKQVPLNELEQHYYTQLAEQCQRYDLGVFRASQTNLSHAPTNIKLADVYVDMLAHEDKPQEVEARQDMQGNRHESKLLLEHLQDTGLSRLVVRGDVGSGKSSFINYLCYSIIESRYGRSTTPVIPIQWLRRPVVRLLLREVGGQIREQGNGLEQVFGFIRERMCTHIKNQCEVEDAELAALWKVFRANFERMGVLVLDGLDEVSGQADQEGQSSRRQILLAGIQQLAQDPRYQGMAIIITSRNHAYGGDDALAGFHLLQLDPLNSSDRYEVFVRHWYEKVALTEEEKRSNQTDARRLLNHIRQRESLQDLTETPLLLTLILVLDKAKIGLPESRAELYEKAVELLLDNWSKQLRPYKNSLNAKERQALTLVEQDGKLLLAAMKVLADKTYREAENKQPTSADEAKHDENNSIVFAVETVEWVLKGQLQQKKTLGFEHQDSCQHFLRFRSQLLVAVGEQVSFVHKSFHEYLAAAYVMERPMSRDRVLWEMASTLIY